MTDFPIVVDESGLQPTPPATIRAALEADIASTNPGYSADLPGSLIEDILSTDVAAVVEMDSARVELVNSLTPYGANAFLLNQLGQIYGVPQNPASNTSVSVVFSGPPGFVIAQGFTVSDGTYQYVVQDGGIIAESGQTIPLFAVATTPGSWDVPTMTVTQIITSVPSTVTLTVTNQTAGTPGAEAESEEDYRARVLQAGLAVGQGMPSLLRTALSKVSGVQARLISVQQQTGGGWKILCGGGDPYEVGDAIFTALFDISTLVGSELMVTGITNANPAVVTTNLNHGYSSGQAINISGVNPSQYNGNSTVGTIISGTEFQINVDASGFPPYVSGGIVTPNLRNVSVSINDFPDTYLIVFVSPPSQTVNISVTWNTTSPNFVSPAAFAQLGGPSLADYINEIFVGQPINLFELQTTLQEAVASILDPSLLTTMVFAVSIDGQSVSPIAGTGIIEGDPESYFLTDVSKITFTQGG